MSQPQGPLRNYFKGLKEVAAEAEAVRLAGVAQAAAESQRRAQAFADRAAQLVKDKTALADKSRAIRAGTYVQPVTRTRVGRTARHSGAANGIRARVNERNPIFAGHKFIVVEEPVVGGVSVEQAAKDLLSGEAVDYFRKVRREGRDLLNVWD